MYSSCNEASTYNMNKKDEDETQSKTEEFRDRIIFDPVNEEQIQQQEQGFHDLQQNQQHHLHHQQQPQHHRMSLPQQQHQPLSYHPHPPPQHLVYNYPPPPTIGPQHHPPTVPIPPPPGYYPYPLYPAQPALHPYENSAYSTTSQATVQSPSPTSEVLHQQSQGSEKNRQPQQASFDTLPRSSPVYGLPASEVAQYAPPPFPYYSYYPPPPPPNYHTHFHPPHPFNANIDDGKHQQENQDRNRLEESRHSHQESLPGSSTELDSSKASSSSLQQSSLKHRSYFPAYSEEDEKERGLKNEEARKKERDLKRRMKEIGAKREEDRTEEEREAYIIFEKRRVKKNKRSRERTKEKREEMQRILTIPERNRTEDEKIWLDIALRAKRRKNEGDRLRRERIKSLGKTSSRSSSVQSLDLSSSDQCDDTITPGASFSSSITNVVSNLQHNESSSTSSPKLEQSKSSPSFTNDERKVSATTNSITENDKESKGREACSEDNKQSDSNSPRSLSPNLLDHLSNFIESPNGRIQHDNHEQDSVLAFSSDNPFSPPRETNERRTRSQSKKDYNE